MSQYLIVSFSFIYKGSTVVHHEFFPQLKPYCIGSVFGPIVENLYYQTKSASNCRSPGTHFQYKSFVIYWVRVLSVKFSLSLISPTFTVLWEGIFGPCQLATIDNSIRCNSLTALPYPLNSFACHIELIQWTWLGKQYSTKNHCCTRRYIRSCSEFRKLCY